MSYPQRVTSILLSLLTITTAATATLPPQFLQNLLSVYDSKIENFFPSSALNSSVALNSFLLDLPPLSNASANEDVSIDSFCNASSSADDCVARLPADPRSQIIVIGDFLSREGQLKDLKKDCVARVASVLLRDPSAPNTERFVMYGVFGAVLIECFRLDYVVA